MDGSRFDDFTRRLATSRRGVLKACLGAAAAGATGLVADVIEAAAQERNPFRRAGKRCRIGQRCGSLAPCTNGVCTPIACWIDRQVYDPAEPNPDNPCQFCIPTVDRYTEWYGIVGDGESCGADRVCCNAICCIAGECCVNGVCDACRPTCEIEGVAFEEGAVSLLNPCERCDPGLDPTGWSPNPGAFCGDADDQVCCDRTCCPRTHCCGLNETCEPCQCEIGGVLHDPGETNPANDCQVCTPSRSTAEWSLVDDGGGCGGVAGRVCCNGECCAPTECCTEAGLCEECGPHCRIDGEDVDAGDANPANPCQVCDPERDPVGWSPADDGAVCGGDLDDELVCCAGRCCGADQCCNDGACGPCGCEIDGRDYDRDQTEPGNECRACKPDVSRDDWTPQPSDTLCGLTNGRYCCAGVCCPDGECCNDIGECEPCGCVILGAAVIADGVNPVNTCEVCKPDRDRTDWTALGNGEACGGPDDDRICCGGQCCEQGECCEDGACRSCGCEIGDATISAQTINPDNPCQICDPSRARLAWSPVAEGTVCGAGEGQVCCGGACCDEGQCCLLEACGECLCAIGADTVAAGVRNLDNPCEECDPKRDPFGWSARQNGEECDGLGDQVCCNGVCCAEGECCALEVCAPCGCEIEGVAVAESVVNPDNVCQRCDSALDRTAWSNNDDAPCGESGSQVCCAGECCPPQHCCTINGACEPCRCLIGDQTYDAFDRNPENDCESCAPFTATDAWSVHQDDTSCGDDGDGKCCSGSCCASDQCCTAAVCGPCGCQIDGEEYEDLAINPDNDCQQCDSLLDPLAWSPVSDAPCGENDERVCCGGECCPEGECCGLDGSCETCRCLIGGALWADGAINPDDHCQVCNASTPAGRTSWSPRFHPDCPPPCEIDNVVYAYRAINPDDECLWCDSGLSLTSWSPADGEVCGEGRDRVCCSGGCCPAGQCCGQNGACKTGFCTPVCTIDGVDYSDGATNPDNPCQVCSVTGDPTGWSATSHGIPCGPNLTQSCCYGACCASGVCCNHATFLCDPATPCAGCTIDGVFYNDNDSNPANGCEVCIDQVSTTAWTLRGDNYYCNPPGSAGDPVCCGGVCCESALICIGGVCAPDD